MTERQNNKVSGWATRRAEELIATLGINTPAELAVEDIAWERGALVRDELLEGSVARLVMLGRRGIIFRNVIPYDLKHI